jgi:hypothetical protein
MKKQWLKLSQVCHQICAEYREFIVPKTHVFVSMNRTVAPSFLKAFFPADGKPTIFGHVKFVFDALVTKNVGKVNILPLMEALEALESAVAALESAASKKLHDSIVAPEKLDDSVVAPKKLDDFVVAPEKLHHSVVALDKSGTCDHAILDMLFAPKNSLREYIMAHNVQFTRIIYSPSYLEVHVRSEFAKPWMPVDYGKGVSSTEWKAADYCHVVPGSATVEMGRRRRHTRQWLRTAGVNMKMTMSWKITVGVIGD